MSVYSTWEAYGNSEPVQISKEDEEKLIEIVSSEHKKKMLSEWEFCIIMVYGKWCAPCKVLKPKFCDLAAQHRSKAYFALENSDLGLTTNLRVVPTIVVYQKGQQVKVIEGGDLTQLNPILEYCQKKQEQMF